MPMKRKATAAELENSKAAKTSTRSSPRSRRNEGVSAADSNTQGVKYSNPDTVSS
jgi:hypothetical protein